MTEREIFKQQIAADPTNEVLRGVFADWLDERGEHEAADLHRGLMGPTGRALYVAAVKNLAYFCGHSRITVEHFLKSIVAGDVCFGDDDGPPDARGNEELWEWVEIVLGEVFTDEHREATTFRCAC